MKLSECKHGVLVQKAHINDKGEIGMVVGITNNDFSPGLDLSTDPIRAIPLVQWQSGDTYSIHHENIQLYKE